MSTDFIKNFLLFFLVLSISIMMGQEKTITGKIVDQAREPLPGASVVAKGTNRGVTSDFDGNYSIRASQGEVLEFSFVGMKDKTQTVDASEVINITLVSDTQLEEVVVTALGVKRQKKSLGYATQKVEGDIVSKTRGSNALKSLSGKVAGLQVSSPSGNLGGSSRILLRGAGSVTQENRPLIIVDGIPFDNTNNNTRNLQIGYQGIDYGDASADINPDDIESINVLKGGPAAALYGSRAQNGAILITTKKGAKGKGVIEFNSGMSFDFINIAPKIQKLYGGGTGDPNTISQPTTFAEETLNGVTYKVLDYGAEVSWGPRYDPNELVLHWDAFDQEFSGDYLTPRPWVYPKNDRLSFFNVGVSLNNGVSFSKGNENGTMRLSINNTKTTGIIPNSKLEKTSANFNGDLKVNNRLKVNLISNLTITDGFNRPAIGYDPSIISQFFQFGQTSLDYERLKKYRLATGRQRPWQRKSVTDPIGIGYYDNPYWVINENLAIDKRTRFYGTLGAKYNITDQIYASGKVYADTYNWEISERIAIGSMKQSSYMERNRDFLELNYEGRLHYDDKFFNEKLNINSFIGANRRDVYRSTEGGNTRGGLLVPGIYNIKNNSVEDPQVEDYNSRKRVNSLFASLTLGYDDFAYLTLTGRNDWSSTLPKENNSYFYPSISSSFVFSKFIKADWLSSGKLRGGWSSVGSDTGPYRLRNTFVSETTFFGKPRYSLPYSSSDPNLRPEFKNTWEVGLEMSFLKNRIRLDATYYDELTKDLITALEHDPSTGYSHATTNAGKLSNKGIEAIVSITPIHKNDFSWNFTWNFNYNTNKLLELSPGVETLRLEQFLFGGVTLDAVVGEPYGVIRGTNFVFDNNGNKVVDDDGRYLETRNVENLGSVLPDYNMGFTNTLSYKNVELSFLIDLQKGGKYRSLTNMFGYYSGILEATVANNIREQGIVLDGVTGTVTYDSEGNYTVTNTSPNTKAIPAQQYGQDFYNRNDAQNVFDADYIKLREISLSYELPDKWTGDSWSARLTVFGRNLAVWGLDNENFDPEVATYGSGNVQGGESGSLPSTKTYGFNVQVKL